MSKHRKIWESINGPIPKDEFGFSYEIHHIDGNRKNNDITNLMCVSIQEHLNIHMKQKDWGAVALISRRIGLGSEYMSQIQKGIKRPGVGGVKKGTVPWNKNRNHSDNTKKNWSEKRKGKRWGPTKISDDVCKKIIQQYNDNFFCITVPNKNGKNGKPLTYKIEFCKMVSRLHNVSKKTIQNIIENKRMIFL